MIHSLFNHPIINLLTLCNGGWRARRVYFLREIISTGKETGNSLSSNYFTCNTLFPIKYSKARLRLIEKVISFLRHSSISWTALSWGLRRCQPFRRIERSIETVERSDGRHKAERTRHTSLRTFRYFFSKSFKRAFNR